MSVAQRRKRLVDAALSYSVDKVFVFRSGYRLTWMRFFVILLVYYKKYIIVRNYYSPKFYT